MRHDSAFVSSGPATAGASAQDLPARDLPAQDLPAWDLGDLYPGPYSPEVEGELCAARAEAKACEAAHAGGLEQMSGRALAAAIGAYERVEERLGRIMSYAQLLFSGDSTDAARGKFSQA